MNEEILAQEEPMNEEQQVQIVEEITPVETTPESNDTVEAPVALKTKLSKKKSAIIAAVAAIIVIVIALLVPSKFDKVQNECVHIAGQIAGSGDYFTIDTYPDVYENMDETMKSLLLPGAQKNALEAIKYANNELGFNGSVYSQMMNTTALMGRQSSENGKYRVSWTYHPDDGLEVTYEKK